MCLILENMKWLNVRYRFYQPKPGTDLAWLSAVTKYIIDHDLHDKAFIDEWVDDFDEYYE